MQVLLIPLKKWKILMHDNHLEEALVAIRRVMRATEINSLSLAKKSQLNALR